MRVAAIDCGTNSVRLLVADVADGAAGPVLNDVHREMRIVRLGQDVDRTGRLAPEALARTGAALADYAHVIDAASAQRVRLVATSATRDAANRADFAAMVRDLLGIEPEVVTGHDEAALSFAGASAGLGRPSSELLVADIGGGSTELVRGDGTSPMQADSMDVGSVRLTERHFRDDPPTPSQVAAAEGDVREALAVARRTVAFDPDVTVVGVAGTVTTLVAMTLGLPRYESARVHGATVTTDAIRATTDDLLAMTHEQRGSVPVIHPGRVDVIAAGAVILRVLLEELGAPQLTASEHDILDGIALSLIDVSRR
ncbi:exopolyphosphatase [uncultured Jatrophihabitans sp.]|uniref:Ppx/GppA phosphatase family protein n=1 Tax=uncultured Jatrophihabitans sp. TaxID=1610747 RepID=UPI0035CBC812